MKKSGILAIAAVAGMASAASAQNTMNWTWTADAGPNVLPGQTVVIELWADWAPQATGYAGSIFSIYDNEGGDSFFGGGGTVNVDEGQGFGRNPNLSSLSSDNGTPKDSDSDGQNDVLDLIDTFQLPPFFNPGFDMSMPMLVYTIEWTVGNNQGDVELVRGAALNTTFTNDVYQDTFGTSVPYTSNDDTLRFTVGIPTPSSMALLGLGGLVATRRRR